MARFGRRARAEGLNLITFPVIIKTQALNRNRYIYSILLVITIATGLASRHFPGILPHWVQLYLGDTLWALMVFLLLGFIFNKKSTPWVAIAALAFSYCIEISQMYHASWIDALRAYPLGGLILGFGFLWSDMVCYTVGVGFGYLMERYFLKGRMYIRAKVNEVNVTGTRQKIRRAPTEELE